MPYRCFKGLFDILSLGRLHFVDVFISISNKKYMKKLFDGCTSFTGKTVEPTKGLVQTPQSRATWLAWRESFLTGVPDKNITEHLSVSRVY